jgi:hypothetical protein
MEINNKIKTGRKPIPVVYTRIIYKGCAYCIGTINSIRGVIQFVIDDEDSEKVINRSWHISSVGYVVSYYPTESGIKQLLLHNFILNRMIFPGRGATESVDHINRNPLDNRKENLRIISQTEQNLNQKKKPRNNIQLPENSGLVPDDIPKHIWYIKPNGMHGDRFGIDLKTENIAWKTSSSKKLSLKEKLNQAKEKLQELYTQFPYLNPTTNENILKAQELNTEFEEIIKLVHTD